jgi:hypothetical protein
MWTTGVNLSFDKMKLLSWLKKVSLTELKDGKLVDLYEYYIQEWAGVDQLMDTECGIKIF